MGLRGGDTFQAADRRRDPHLWIILSDPQSHPADAILIANLTTRRSDSDTACVLNKGEHPFIKHDSCVNYQDSRLVDGQNLRQAFASKVLLPRQPVSAALLRRIRAGAAHSNLIPLDNLQLLKDQGLVE